MNKVYDRPFLTFEQQLNHLYNDKKLKKGEFEEDYEILKTYSYYNLINGYKEHFAPKDNYNNKISLKELSEIYLMDKEFLGLIFKYSTYVEDIFKHRFAYAISGMDYKHVDYKNYLRDPKIYDKNSFKNEDFKKTRTNILKAASSQDNPTKYYREKHNHIPAWILFKNTHFNDTINLFSFCRRPIKEKFFEQYNIINKINFETKDNEFMTKNKLNIKKIKLFIDLIHMIRIIRNKIAHNLKVFNFKTDKNIQNYFNIILNENINILTKKSNINDNYSYLYYCVISIIILLDNDKLIDKFLMEIKELFNNKNNISVMYLKMYRFPNNFISRIVLFNN